MIATAATAHVRCWKSRQSAAHIPSRRCACCFAALGRGQHLGSGCTVPRVLLALPSARLVPLAAIPHAAVCMRTYWVLQSWLCKSLTVDPPPSCLPPLPTDPLLLPPPLLQLTLDDPAAIVTLDVAPEAADGSDAPQGELRHYRQYQVSRCWGLVAACLACWS